MGEKDTPKKKISELRSKKSNPLSPKYKIGRDKNGNDIEIGEITDQRPKGLFHKRKLSSRH